MSKLQDKIAAITGSTQGLGAAIALLFAEEGARGVVICGRNRAKGEALADKINSNYEAQALYIPSDLSRVEDCQRLIQTSAEVFGRIDVLVNSAAMTDRGTILDSSPELFDAMFAVNTRAPFFLIQEAVKVMIPQNIEGSIINIGSVSAMAGQPFIAAYCASKGALSTLTRNTAFALMRNRIRVNQLNPGWMASDGEDKIQREYHGAADDWLKKASAQQPFGRLVEPMEVARACLFLASSDSGMMTGAEINLDQSVWGAYEAGAPTPSQAMQWAEASRGDASASSA